MAYVFDGFFVWYEPSARIFSNKIQSAPGKYCRRELIEVAEFVARRTVRAAPALARRISAD